MIGRDGGPRPVDALVLGSGVNLIEVVRALAMAGVRSRVVPVPGEPAARSRHATVIATRDWADPEVGGEDEFVAWLVEYGRRQRDRLPILFTSDETLLLVSAHRDALAEAYRLVLPPHRLVLDCADKGRFADLARHLGLPVPPTVVVDARPGSPPPEVAALGLPLVLKPQRRDRGWHEGLAIRGKAVHVGSAAELVAAWPAISRLHQTILVQHAVPGREDRVESYHVYVDAAGRIAGEFTGRKIRTLPLEYGHTTALEINDAHDVRNLGRNLVDRLGLIGVAKFDFKRDADGRLYLLEVNPRCHLWYHPAARAGVNIPALVHADLTGLARPATATPPAPVTWCHPNDLAAARQDGITPWAWARWAVRCEAKAFWAWDDPVPLAAAGVKRLRR